MLRGSQSAAELHCIVDVGTHQSSAMTDLNSARIAREIGADESLVMDVIARLGPVRGDLTDSGFFTLVRDVVRTKIRFAQRDADEDLTTVRVRPLDD
jgi:hypothetical protein